MSATSLWFQCSSCYHSFEGTRAIKQHCLAFSHDPYECFYCSTLLQDDVALANHYNATHPHDPDSDSDSDSDILLTPTCLGPSKVDVEVQTVPEDPYDNQNHGQTVAAIDALTKPEQTRVPPPSTLAPQPSRAAGTAGPPPAVERTVKEHCCSRCDINFTDIYALNNHLAQHAWCPLCRTLQPKHKTKLKKHVASSHQGQVPEICCASDIGRDANIFGLHLASREHERGKSYCRLCHQDFKKLEELTKHLATAHGAEIPDGGRQKAYDNPPVSTVDKTSISKNRIPDPPTPISNAATAEKLEDIREFYCPDCKTTFDSLNALYKHLTKHSRCPFCPVTVLSTSAFQKHLTSAHSDRIPPRCCKKHIDSIQTYVSHLRGKKHKLGAQCQLCGKTYRNSNAEEHFRSSHKDGVMSKGARETYMRARVKARVVTQPTITTKYYTLPVKGGNSKTILCL